MTSRESLDGRALAMWKTSSAMQARTVSKAGNEISCSESRMASEASPVARISSNFCKENLAAPATPPVIYGLIQLVILEASVFQLRGKNRRSYDTQTQHEDPPQQRFKMPGPKYQPILAAL